MADVYVFTEEGVSIENYRSKKDGGSEDGGGEGPAIFGSSPQDEDDDEEEESEEGQLRMRRQRREQQMHQSPTEVTHTGDDDLGGGSCGDGGEGDGDSSDGDGSRDGGDEEEEIRRVPLDDYGEDEGVEGGLNPLSNLLRLAKSSNFHDGEMVIRSLHETLFYVIDSPEDIKTVLEVMTSLSANNEPVLRTDLMEQVPQIAFLCHDHPEKLGGLVTGNLVPMVVKFLTDPSDLVRKTAQAALLVLLEQELVSHKDVNDQVCPVILDLTEPDATDYFKTEAVALMSKMAPLVGREMTERLFMQRFTRLCSDTLFQVRKVCAANFGELSGVVGTEGTESVLLPYFLNLCKDGVWGVRKACADVFMVVSCACSLETRKARLAPLFVSLLSDESRWVRLAAFQNLGPFISTFADPTVTGLHYNDQGILFIGSPPEDSHQQQQQPLVLLDADNIVHSEEAQKSRKENENESHHETQTSEEGASEDDYTDESSVEVVELKFSSLSDEEDEIIDRNENFGIHFESSPFSISTTNCANYVEFTPIIDAYPPKPGSSDSETENPEFNEINYWRVPLPEIELDFLNEMDLDEIAESPVSPQPEESTENAREEIRPSSNRDIVQEELEALAASLAESIFCNDSNSETKIFDRMGSDDPTRDGSLSNFSESSDNCSSHPQSELTYSESSKPTYAEVCASTVHSTSRNENNCRTKEVEQDEGNAEDAAQEKIHSFSNIESDSGDNFENKISEGVMENSQDESFLLGKFDCSKSLHNLSTLSNLSALNGSSRSSEGDANKSIYSIWSSEKPRSFREAQKMFNINVNLNQDIVPKTLLEHYISMTDPVRAETVDDEITRHCAFSLPAVALTLGRKYWFVLRETYVALASDMHWKVRRTLAFSIHEMALILGEELAQKDLLPVFEGLIKDLDEVRIGVLKHLAHFLKMLPPSQRKLFLPRLSEFLTPDNAHNWRFRLELAHQLAPISELFSPQECWTHICPITFDLMGDKVVEIRRTCFGVVSHLTRQLISENKDCYMNTHIVPFSERLIEDFAQAKTWTRRQSYAYVVGQIIKDNSLSLPIVCYLLLPKFLDLSKDKVPNIRLVVARIINTDICSQDYFHNPENEAASRVRETLFKLQNDIDRDVHYFACYSAYTELSETENQDPNLY